MIIERELIEVRWTCPACAEQNDLEAPIWEDHYGEYVPVECPNCYHEECVYLGGEN